MSARPVVAAGFVPGAVPARIPWTTVGGGVLIAGLLVLRALVLASPPSPLTVRLVQLALAACTAYVLDDAAAPLTTVTPRSGWLRRLPSVLVGLVVIGAAWAVLLRDLRGTPETGALTLELAVLVVVAVAASAALTVHGDPEPGNLVAVLVPLGGLATIVLGAPLRLEVFIGGTVADEPARAAAWLGCGVIALVLLARSTRT